MNNEISKLPENPNCPDLSLLSLRVNHRLRVIPPLFFQSMPVLRALNLSQTRIKSLPQSFSQLIQLETFILRDCELFKELPDEVGELCDLKVLDLEGTEIINLPVSVRKLTKLTHLKVSFCCERKNPQSNRIIPQNVISSLLKLEELSIDVNPEDERWNVTVKDIVNEICCLKKLLSLNLYLPEVVLLNDLSNIRSSSWSTNLSQRWFRLTVGSHQKCIISRLPQEFAVKCEERKRCLRYVNGEGVPTEIKKVLQYATSLFLHRHLTVTSLSEFGIENMKNLRFCILKECNEVQTIVEEDDDRNVFGSLQYLNLYYLKNLRSISMKPLGQGSLSYLKALKLYSCPQLTTIFTLNLLGLLTKLEELVVEDCPKIESIVSHHCRWGQYQLQCFLPNLKKIALHYMPSLVSISNGVWIGKRLEWLSCYDCPSLKTLYPEEFTSHNLKVVIGEADWWSALQWNESAEHFQPPNLDDIFVPIEKDTDLMTRLAEINDQLKARKPKQEPGNSQQSGWFFLFLKEATLSYYIFESKRFIIEFQAESKQAFPKQILLIVGIFFFVFVEQVLMRLKPLLVQY